MFWRKTNLIFFENHFFLGFSYESCMNQSLNEVCYLATFYNNLVFFEKNEIIAVYLNTCFHYFQIQFYLVSVID